MRHDVLAIVQLGVGFFLLFSAFNAQGFIEISFLRSLSQTEPSRGITQNSGYISLSIIYFVGTISNLIAPPIIKVLGSKWSQVLGSLLYTSFMVSFLHLHGWILYFFSGVLGFAAAILWTGNGVYLVEFSRNDNMSRNTGILWAMLQSSLVAGACFLLYVVSKGDIASSYKMVYSVFSGLAALSVLVLMFLPKAPENISKVDSQSEQLGNTEDSDEPDKTLIIQDERDRKEEFGKVDSQSDQQDVVEESDLPEKTLIIQDERDWKEEFVHTFSLLKSTRIMVLSIVFVFTGLEITFFSGVYSACLTAATALNNGSDVIIPYNAFSLGAGQIVGGLVFGMCMSSVRLSRSHVIFMAMVLHLIAFYLCFLNLPMESPMHKTSATAYIHPSVTVALVTGFLLGLADACWNTQIYTLIGSLYKNDSSSAFALFKFFQNLGAAVSFCYASFLHLHWQLLILALGAVSAALCFFSAQNEAERLEPTDK